MTPFKTALWIAKFVASLFLLLIVIPLIPLGLWTGGKYALEKYHERKDAQEWAMNNAALPKCQEDKAQSSEGEDWFAANAPRTKGEDTRLPIYDKEGKLVFSPQTSDTPTCRAETTQLPKCKDPFEEYQNEPNEPKTCHGYTETEKGTR